MNTLLENQLGIAMLVSALGMFAVMFLTIYSAVRRHRAAEAAAREKREGTD